MLSAVRYLFLASICVLWSGCGSRPTASQAVVAPAGNLTAPSSLADATHQITLLVQRWQQEFSGSRWQAIKDSFTSRSEGAALVSQMIRWRRGRVRQLHIVPTYVQQMSAGRYVGTLRFTDDPRAVPAYRIYLFHLQGANVQVTGATSGIEGSTYQNVHWSVTHTAHFTFYHSPYELQGSDRQYATDLEYQRTQIARKFAVALPPRATYYLYPATSLMARLTSKSCGANPDNVGCTDPYTQPPSIQTSLWPTYHEPIHVYELALQPPVTRTSTGNSIYSAPLFIAEGTAVALEDREADPRLSDYCSTLVYIPLDACAQIAIDQTHPLNLLSDRGFNRADASNAYALSGSFVKYLILQYGYRPFGKFYYGLAAQPSDTLNDYNRATRAIYHRPMAQLLSAWQHQLCAHGCG